MILQNQILSLEEKVYLSLEDAIISGEYKEATRDGYGLLGWNRDSTSQIVEYELFVII